MLPKSPRERGVAIGTLAAKADAAQAAQKEIARLKTLLAESRARELALCEENDRLRQVGRLQCVLPNRRGWSSPIRFMPGVVVSRGESMVTGLVRRNGKWWRYAVANPLQLAKNAHHYAMALLQILEEFSIAKAAGELTPEFLAAHGDECDRIVQEIYCPTRGPGAGVISLNPANWQETETAVLQ